MAASRETSGDQAEPRQGDDGRSGRKGRGLEEQEVEPGAAGSKRKESTFVKAAVREMRRKQESIWMMWMMAGG